jgi:hypothetical protein
MPAELITSKLLIPLLRPSLVPRPRLVQFLNEGLYAKRKLTLISAPAGFGKTTLVVDWLKQVDLPAAWLSLDEADNDLPRFLAYLAAALQQVDEEAGAPLQSSLQSPQFPADLPAAVKDRPGAHRPVDSALPLPGRAARLQQCSLFAPEVRSRWIGAWDLLALMVVLSVFNTFLGEEFIFRGALLPKMKGVFGRWDWVANAVIFGLYHLHQPRGIPGSILSGSLYAFTARRYRTTWFSIILHSGQSLFFIFLILVLGLA